MHSRMAPMMEKMKAAMKEAIAEPKAAQLDSWWLIPPSSGCTTQGHSSFEGISREDWGTPRGLADLLMALGDDAWAAVVGVLFRPYY